jgi:phosphoribosylglycinamide formyltransferase-1
MRSHAKHGNKEQFSLLKRKNKHKSATIRDMKKIAVLFSGHGTNFAYLADNLKDDIEITLAITNNPQASGQSIAKKHGIALEVIDQADFGSREEFDEALVQAIKKADVDLVVLAGFMRILTPVFTKQVKSINLHPSLLPRHKGVNAIEKSFSDEHKEGGVSVHWVSSELDGGEIILQKVLKKEGLSFEQYDMMIREMEKEALFEAIRVVLS